MNGFALTLIILLIVSIIGFVVSTINQREREKVAAMSSEEKQKYLEEKHRRLAEANKRFAEANERRRYGGINAAMICPHCQVAGKIRTKNIKQKKGVSGGKATAALLTLGVSLLAVGLSRKEQTTEVHCDNCNNTWYI